ncbi:MAG TPA: tRNA 2-thiouridine(34) synthase MnmA, partial [Deltaproteobacteria bacterium]|nr:tRNA 2-thiouridine(34) synthase MnmA [Deltaproteobacteria bacterium]
HMRLHDVPAAGPASRCCGYDDAKDARMVADALSIPFYVMNLREAFERAVMDDLADTYLAGQTPNPCIRCNGVLKFRVLLARALALGASHLATGHYARIEADGAGPRLAMATDHDKDQSYFLFPITAQALQRTLFPLGGMTKAEVRGAAQQLALPVADKPESQEICFLPEGDHASFVRSRHPDTPAGGDIVTEDGGVVGQHDGYYRFTVGQRRGLGVSLGQPAWVLRIDAASRTVVVTTDPDRLGKMGLVASGAIWHAPPTEPLETVTVRIRHRGRRHPAQIRIDGERFLVAFESPVRAIAPGQAAVIYSGDRVAGGGWIGRGLSSAELTSENREGAWAAR